MMEAKPNAASRVREIRSVFLAMTRHLFGDARSFHSAQFIVNTRGSGENTRPMGKLPVFILDVSVRSNDYRPQKGTCACLLP